MHVINARNVNHALSLGVQLMLEQGEEVRSRNGETLEVLFPVSTVYHKPWERVLVSSARDANPFFHLMEALWILHGRQDVGFLTYFNKRMADYSDDGSTFNAPYGHRIKNHFGVDQLNELISTLKSDPLSRQAVLQIWDVADLTKQTKDKACNMQAVFRVRNGKLCLTVYNRSNDMIWGAYGANVVQFSMLQEYIAAHLDLPLGTYTQVSNSYHVYLGGAGGNTWNKVATEYSYFENLDMYDTHFNTSVYMVNEDMEAFSKDLHILFSTYDTHGMLEVSEMNCWNSHYFKSLVVPMLRTFVAYRQKDENRLLENISDIVADDWLAACSDWLSNRGVEL